MNVTAHSLVANAGAVRALAMGAIALALACPSCSDQPATFCTSARVPYAARYTLVSGAGPCAGLTGEVLGVYTFNGANGDQTPNWADATLSIQPMGMYGQQPTAPGDQVLSLGHFDSARPGADGLCSVSQMSPAVLHVAAVDEASVDPASGSVVCPSPARTVRYDWSRVAVVVTPAVVGTALSADLTYTVDDCVATYRVWAVSPVVSCAAPPAPSTVEEEGPDAGENGGASVGDGVDAADDAGATGGQAGGQDAGPALPEACVAPPPPAAVPIDPSLCLPPDPPRGRYLGSGLNPDWAIACDGALTLCLPAADPTLRAGR